MVDGGLPLVIVAESLPAAIFGRSYAGALMAEGGTLPYAWSVSGGALPDGLTLTAGGALEGMTSQALTTARFTARVTDASGGHAERAFELVTLPPSNLTLATRALVAGVQGQTSEQPLLAVSGRPPYTFAVSRFQRLAVGPTELPGTVEGELPSSTGLVVSKTAEGTSLTGVPATAGVFALTLTVTDADGVTDSSAVHLAIAPATPLWLTTDALPDAVLGQRYAAQLAASEPDAPRLTFELACLHTPGPTPGSLTCAELPASQQPPAGLRVGPDGLISGTPTGAEGIFSFLVEVSDGLGRSDLRALTVRVRPASKPGGCGTVPGGELVGLALALVAARRRAGPGRAGARPE